MTLTALGGRGGQWGGATNTAGGRGGSGSGGYKTEQGGDGSDGQAGQALLVGNGASSYWGGGGRAGQLSGNPEFALAPAAGVHTIIAIHTRQDVAGTELMACW